MKPQAIQLLVSVRNAQEATVAVQGGADIIDVKEPDQGSLGFAGLPALNAVISAIGNRAPVSAALGECREWLNGPPTDNSRQPSTITPALPAGLAFFKLGLADMLTVSRWPNEWMQVRRRMQSNSVSQNVGAIAVAYADNQLAKSPPVQDVLQAAIETGCRGLLIDTFRKDHRTTFDWLTESELSCLADEAKAAGLMFALAGQLNAGHMAEINRIAPTVVGVRGAVCDGADRTAALSADKVAELKAALSSGCVNA